MYLVDATLDDLLRRVFERLLKRKALIVNSRGSTIERTGVLLKLKNPKARLSHTEKRGVLFSALGELIWYLASSNQLKFIKYYIQQYTENSDDHRTIHGAYGPRLFNMRGINQVQNVIDWLKDCPNSRRAVIHLFNAEDLVKRFKDIPCTCTLQFMIRRGRLDLLTSMRSNDAYIGLPHDVFAFTMLQEIIANTIGVELGEYKHFIGSLHLYTKHVLHAEKYLEEGWQSSIGAAMPAMPRGSPWPSIASLIRAESKIRRGHKINASDLDIDPYWQDLVRLLQIFRCSKNGKPSAIKPLRAQMSSSIYDAFISKKQARASKASLSELTLPFPEKLEDDYETED